MVPCPSVKLASVVSGPGACAKALAARTNIIKAHVASLLKVFIGNLHYFEIWVQRSATCIDDAPRSDRAGFVQNQRLVVHDVHKVVGLGRETQAARNRTADTQSGFVAADIAPPQAALSEAGRGEAKGAI